MQHHQLKYVKQWLYKGYSYFIVWLKQDDNQWVSNKSVVCCSGQLCERLVEDEMLEFQFPQCLKWLCVLLNSTWTLCLAQKAGRGKGGSLEVGEWRWRVCAGGYGVSLQSLQEVVSVKTWQIRCQKAYWQSDGSATALWGVDKLRGNAVGLRYDVISGVSEGSGDSVSSPRPQTDHFAR